jgi:LysR family glycine cleavage system transcriptional activator
MARLPPFDGLIAFDATVRHGSMTRAASELGLSQSAVSHRIRRLAELIMGMPLLQRSGSGLKPTEVGEAMADGLTALLADLAGPARAYSRSSGA